MTVYTFDKNDGVIKIEKRGGKYCVYKVDSVERRADGTLKWKFQKKNIGCQNFKPYEDKDVSDDPNNYFEDLRRWQPYKVSWG